MVAVNFILYVSLFLFVLAVLVVLFSYRKLSYLVAILCFILSGILFLSTTPLTADTSLLIILGLVFVLITALFLLRDLVLEQNQKSKDMGEINE